MTHSIVLFISISPRQQRRSIGNAFYKANSKSGKYTKNHIRDIFESLYKTGTDKVEKLYRDHIQDSYNKSGVYSLSSKNSDILMWSHYTDGHRGYCFELGQLSLKPGKVKYRNRYPSFNVFDRKNQLQRTLYTKSSHWKYEREWRYFSKHSGNISIQDNSIKSVILGSQMDSINRKALLGIIDKSSHDPDIYEAIINHREYSVHIKKYR